MMTVMSDDSGSGWVEFYAWTAGREPRPMLLQACERLGPGAGRTAVDLGCGEGTDALALLARGWSVVAIDSEQAGLDLFTARVPAGNAGQVRAVCASYADVDLPRAHLVHAGFSLPFCAPDRFGDLWARIRRALLPGGIFAGQLFGPHDSWAGSPGMVFHDRSDVDTLLAGLEILELRETDEDGQARSGPKHWHLFDIVAREPATP
jgi:SAM-dependent methyltransferase